MSIANVNGFKTPKGMGMHVLYLDFDGVLHHENVLWHPRRGAYLDAPWQCTLFQHCDLLIELLTPYPDLKIVLSTSWVKQYGCKNAAKKLPKPLRDRVVGATFHSQMNEIEFTSAPRGMQVWGDVVRRRPSAWLALDDDYLHWPEWCLDNYVRTDDFDGISEPSVCAEIKMKLSVMGGQQ
jgi:hypothetical protein